MLFSTHLLTGSAIGLASDNIALNLVLGVIVHHVLDWIPHYDPSSFKTGPTNPQVVNVQFWFMGLTDMVMGIGFLGIILFLRFDQSNILPILAGAFGNLLPDIIDVTPIVSDIFQKTQFGKVYHNFHIKLHNTLSYKKAVIGAVIQIVLMTGSVWILLTK